MRRDAQAECLWGTDADPSHGMCAKLSRGRYGLTGEITERAAPQVMRLALIYAALDGALEINCTHLRAAEEVWRYCEDSARFIFGNRLEDPFADEVLRAVAAHSKGATRDDLQNYFGRHKRAEAISAALSMLSDRGLVRGESVSTGGRPAERWFVPPSGGSSLER